MTQLNLRWPHTVRCIVYTLARSAVVWGWMNRSRPPFGFRSESGMINPIEKNLGFKWNVYQKQFNTFHGFFLHCDSYILMISYDYPLVNSHITMEHHHVQLEKSIISMVIFNSKLLVITRGHFGMSLVMDDPSWCPQVRFGQRAKYHWYNISGLEIAGTWSEMMLGEPMEHNGTKALLKVH